MVSTINDIPVFNALISDEECGMWRISLVDDPAVMSNFLAFADSKKTLSYAVQDDEKRIVRGVVMRANFPIYRCDQYNGEYYVLYAPAEIRKMAEKYLAESRQNEVNLMHQFDTDGVQMVQYFIKDSTAGVNPAGFEDIADGSLFAEFHILNDSVWRSVKDGTFKGFSLEGTFDLRPNEKPSEVKDIAEGLDYNFSRYFKHISNTMSKLSRFKTALAKVFAEFGNITTDKGILSWDGEDDIAEGVAVFIEDAEGNRTTPEDGDYTSSEGTIYSIADGKVSAITESQPVEEAVEPTAEEMADMNTIATDKGKLAYEGDFAVGVPVFVIVDEIPQPAEDGEYVAEDCSFVVAGGIIEAINPLGEAEPAPEEVIDELRKKCASLEAQNKMLKAKVIKLSKMSSAKPAHAEVVVAQRYEKTGVRGLDNLARVLSAK